MTKRSPGHARAKGDFYRTWDPATVAPLLRHLEPGTDFVEPCAGDGVLMDHLQEAGHLCIFASDLDPKRDDVAQRDALTDGPWPPADVFITNPPWTRSILHALIPHLAGIAPTWLLFDADWAFTGQAVPFLSHCHLIVSVGRVKWIEGSKHVGKDNAAWYLFDYSRPALGGGPVFINDGGGRGGKR
jgi:hypothetical protein